MVQTPTKKLPNNPGDRSKSSQRAGNVRIVARRMRELLGPPSHMKFHLEKLRTTKTMTELVYGPPQVGDIHSQILLTAKKTKQDYFQKPNSRINDDLFLWDLTLIKANLEVFLSLQADVIAVGWQENTNYSGKCCQSITPSQNVFLFQKKGFWKSSNPKLNEVGRTLA